MNSSRLVPYFPLLTLPVPIWVMVSLRAGRLPKEGGGFAP